MKQVKTTIGELGDAEQSGATSRAKKRENNISTQNIKRYGSADEYKKHNPNTPAILSLIINVAQWFVIERVIGIALVLYAIIMLFPELRTGTSIEKLYLETKINITALTHWYMMSGVVLILFGERIKFNVLVLATFPFMIDSLFHIFYALHNAGQSVAIVREFIIQALVARNVFMRLAHDIKDKAGIN